MTWHAAVDLGAASGRVAVAEVGPSTLELHEVHRFANEPVRLPDGLHWDILGLYRETLTGLRAAATGGTGSARLDSAGIDSWAVDYGLLDSTGALLGLPYHYRDTRTDGLSRVDDYSITGIQYLPFNTVYQLLAEPADRLAAARGMLLIPDLLCYWLTGAVGAEQTNASTTALYDVTAGQWAWSLVERLGLPAEILPPLRSPGTTIGTVGTVGTLGGLPLVAVGSHDTASAVVAVPATGDDFAYVSCGTWSLVGVELDRPVLTEASRAANFTNEVGVDGTIRYLRNVMGLWLLQECQREWGEREWGEPDSGGLLAAAEAAPPFAAVVDPDDHTFLPPGGMPAGGMPAGGMPARIDAYCVRTGQRPPGSRPAYVRCVLESLALGHRAAIRDAGRLSGRTITVVHMVGGGARNALLCQLTADACGLDVVAGPVEATALGNALVQARVHNGPTSLRAMRELVARTQPVRRYRPRGDQAVWDRAATLVDQARADQAQVGLG